MGVSGFEMLRFGGLLASQARFRCLGEKLVMVEPYETKDARDGLVLRRIEWAGMTCKAPTHALLPSEVRC